MEKLLCNPSQLQVAALPLATDAANTSQSVGKIRILRLPEVISRVGLKRSSVYQHINTGDFPKPVSLGPRAVGWLEHEIDAWLSERIQMRHYTPTSP
jgi:prophage regulatory protein